MVLSALGSEGSYIADEKEIQSYIQLPTEDAISIQISEFFPSANLNQVSSRQPMLVGKISYVAEPT